MVFISLSCAVNNLGIILKIIPVDTSTPQMKKFKRVTTSY